MTNLSARQIKCLRLLWEEQDFRPAGYLAEKLQVSDKTVLQDIKAIQEYLDQASKAQSEVSDLKREVFRLQQKLDAQSRNRG